MNNPVTQNRIRRVAPRMIRILWCAILCIVLGMNRLPAYGQGPEVQTALRSPQAGVTQASGNVVSPELQQALTTVAPEARLRIVVRFKSQADLGSIASHSLSPSAAVPARRAQLRAGIVNALQAVSDATQSAFAPFLSSPSIAAQVDSVRPFWIFNGAGLSATPQAISAIAARNDVASITLDHWRKWVDAAELAPVAQATLPPARIAPFAPQDVPAPGGTPWGVIKIQADQVWTALGITGAGVTVASVDSGVDWQHPALQSNYRGWRSNAPADHLHNWFDATDEGALYPTDMLGHGTHTMGTMVGQGGIGVAPGARWMAAKGLNGQGFGYDSWLHAAFQFILAPGGDPSYAPDVLNNSWGDNDGTSTYFFDDIEALRSAGIFVVFANGNAGPRAGTVGSPASLPNAVGIGATDQDDEVTYFSSRGPSPFGDIRPVLSAPGLQVVSSYPGGRYASGSGTSMATPHVAGTAALLLSANPSLDITRTLYALTSTAVPLTSVVPNNDSGWGRIDAYKAVLSVIDTGVIKGVVLDGAQPVVGALVTAGSGLIQVQALTGADGSYAMRAAPGIYTATASAFGYYDASVNAQLVVHNQEKTFNLNLSRKPYGVVSGSAFDAVNGKPVTATLVSALGTPRASLANIDTPPLYFLSLPTGVYTLEARALGYIVQTRAITISDGIALNVTFNLTPTQRIALVDTGAWYYGSGVSYYRAALNALAMPYDELRVKHVPEDTPTITRLLSYDTVIWSSPQDSPALIGASDVISTLLDKGRNLLISGQDIGFYDGGGFFFEQPYFRKLNAYYVADNAPTRVVEGMPDSILNGKVLTITGAGGLDNQSLPDIITLRNPDHGSQIARYSEGQNAYDGAAIYSQNCLNYRAAYFSFGIEAIYADSARADVIGSVLHAFDAPRPTSGVEARSNDNYPTGAPIGLPGQTLTHAVRLRNTGEAGVTDTLSISLSRNQWVAVISPTQVVLPPCATATVNISVTIPLTASRNAQDVTMLTVTSANSPTLSTAISLTTKTPAGILLVDDDRFFNREQDYLDALGALGNLADRFDNQWQAGLTVSPDITLLKMYPTVVWFNGYDWFDPITLAQEGMLSQYLDGGGRLFFTSQAALAYTNLSDFNRNYLGVSAIDNTDTTVTIAGVPDTLIGAGFSGGSMLPFPYYWNLSSAILPISNTQVILHGDSGQPFGLAREGVTAAFPWRTTFMPFAFEALTRTVRADLMNRVIGWLSWLGRSSLTAGAPPGGIAQAGAPITFTAVLRADDMPAPVLHDPAVLTLPLTTSVAVSIPLSSNLYVVSSTLPNASGHNAGEWSGPMSAHDVMTFTVVATSTAGLSDGTALTATLFVDLDALVVRFARTAVVHINTPALMSTLDIQPEPPQWRKAITVTLHVANTSGVMAPSASVMNAVPFVLTLITPSLALTGGGVISATGNRINWAGGIDAGQSITVSYVVSLPRLSPFMPSTFYNAAEVNNGAGLLTQSALWITPQTRVYYMPLLSR